MQQFVRGIRFLIDGCGFPLFVLYAGLAFVTAIACWSLGGPFITLAYVLALAWGVYGTGEIEGDGTETNADYDALRRK